MYQIVVTTSITSFIPQAPTLHLLAGQLLEVLVPLKMQIKSYSLLKNPQVTSHCGIQKIHTPCHSLPGCQLSGPDFALQS